MTEVTQGSAGIVLTGDSIQAYRYLATLRGLKMEIDMVEKFRFPPTACPTRGRSLGSAKRILAENGYEEPLPRTRKACYEQMEALCQRLGLV